MYTCLIRLYFGIDNSYMKTTVVYGRLRLECDGTRAETRFCLSAKRMSPFKSAERGGSVQSTTGSRGVRISSSNARYTMLQGSVKGTGHPLLSPVSPSLPFPCVTLCQHISAGLYDIVSEEHTALMLMVVGIYCPEFVESSTRQSVM